MEAETSEITDSTSWKNSQESSDKTNTNYKQREDWPQVRSRLLRQLMDAGTSEPTDGSEIDNESWRPSQEYGNKTNISKRQLFTQGAGYPSKNGKTNQQDTES